MKTNIWTKAPSVAGHLAVAPSNSNQRTPSAVLRPAHTDDVVRMVRFCAEQDIEVHTQGYGRIPWPNRCPGFGLTVDMKSLGAVGTPADGWIEVEGGASWKRVLHRALAHGSTPPVLTAFQSLTVGGTLSVGGFSGISYNRGAQVDHVMQLDVVTGQGREVRCSRTETPALFDAMRAGLGQCGVIVGAKLRLVQAPAVVRHTVLSYGDVVPFFDDLCMLAQRKQLDGLSGTITLHPGGDLLYEINVLSYSGRSGFEGPSSSLGGTSPDTTCVRESGYEEYFLQVDALFDDLHANGMWDGFAHPWFDVFLPQSTMLPFLQEVLPSLDPAVDVGPSDYHSIGQIHLFPLITERLSAPMLRVPSEEIVFLFDILTSSRPTAEKAEFQERMHGRNRRMFELARGLGGTPYNISATPMAKADWAQAFGPSYPLLRAQKLEHDPSNVMMRSRGVF